VRPTVPEKSGAMVQQFIAASAVKVASTSPVAKSHSFRVRSSEPERAVLPLGSRTTAFTELLR